MSTALPNKWLSTTTQGKACQAQRNFIEQHGYFDLELRYANLRVKVKVDDMYVDQINIQYPDGFSESATWHGSGCWEGRNTGNLMDFKPAMLKYGQKTHCCWTVSHMLTRYQVVDGLFTLEKGLVRLVHQLVFDESMATIVTIPWVADPNHICTG